MARWYCKDKLLGVKYGISVFVSWQSQKVSFNTRPVIFAVCHFCNLFNDSDDTVFIVQYLYNSVSDKSILK